MDGIVLLSSQCAKVPFFNWAFCNQSTVGYERPIKLIDSNGIGTTTFFGEMCMWMAIKKGEKIRVAQQSQLGAISSPRTLS